MRAFVEREQTRLRQSLLPDKNPLLKSLHHDCLRASGEANCKGGAVSRAELAGSAARAVDPAFRGPHVLSRTLAPTRNITIQQGPQLRFRQKPNSKVRYCP